MTKIVNTAGKIVVFVEVPENADQFYIPINGTHVWYKVNDKPNFNTMLTDGRWQILGDSRTLTEEQMKEICETRKVKQSWDSHTSDLFIDYANAGKYVESVQEGYSSLKEANGIVDSNPLGEKPKRFVGFFHAGFMTERDHEELGEYQESLNKWDEAQSLVKRFLVLVSQE